MQVADGAVKVSTVTALALTQGENWETILDLRSALLVLFDVLLGQDGGNP